ncbi:hypothetical protein FJ979_30180, partial [Mesorhizobium sp. B1-1-6]
RYGATNGALASGFVTAELHHLWGHDLDRSCQRLYCRLVVRPQGDSSAPTTRKMFGVRVDGALSLSPLVGLPVPASLLRLSDLGRPTTGSETRIPLNSPRSMKLRITNSQWLGRICAGSKLVASIEYKMWRTTAFRPLQQWRRF